MSPRRKQSTKELGAILNEAVPHVVAEEVQLPADSPLPTPEGAETAQKALEQPVEAQTPSDAPSAASEGPETPHTPTEPPPRKADMTENALQPLPDTGLDPAPTSPLAAVTAEEAAPSPQTTAVPAQKPEIAPAEEADPAPGAGSEVPAFQPIPDVELSFVDDAGGAAREPEEVAEKPVEPVTWRKSTIPFREDQYEEIGRLLAEFRADHGVQLTIAEVIRLGLDKQIAAFQDDETRPELLAELYAQQLRESQGNENLKHSRSHGLGQFLRGSGSLA